MKTTLILWRILWLLVVLPGVARAANQTVPFSGEVTVNGIPVVYSLWRDPNDLLVRVRTYSQTGVQVLVVRRSDNVVHYNGASATSHAYTIPASSEGAQMELSVQSGAIVQRVYFIMREELPIEVDSEALGEAIGAHVAAALGEGLTITTQGELSTGDQVNVLLYGFAAGASLGIVGLAISIVRRIPSAGGDL